MSFYNSRYYINSTAEAEARAVGQSLEAKIHRLEQQIKDLGEQLKEKARRVSSPSPFKTTFCGGCDWSWDKCICPEGPIEDTIDPD